MRTHTQKQYAHFNCRSQAPICVAPPLSLRSNTLVPVLAVHRLLFFAVHRLTTRLQEVFAGPLVSCDLKGLDRGSNREHRTRRFLQQLITSRGVIPVMQNGKTVEVNILLLPHLKGLVNIRQHTSAGGNSAAEPPCPTKKLQVSNPPPVTVTLDKIVPSSVFRLPLLCPSHPRLPLSSNNT